MAKMSELERKLEANLAEALGRLFHFPVLHMEEVICKPKNKWLKGGKAMGLVARLEPARYCGIVTSAIPCSECQDVGHSLNSCNCQLHCRQRFDIDPDLVPEEFQSNVGEDPKVVMEWAW
jgi:hypothetical protein